MKNKQTAVQWLAEQFEESFSYINEIFKETIEKAEEMDKQQKIEDYRDGRTDQQSGSQSRFYNRSSETWYNETYNNDRAINTNQED